MDVRDDYNILKRSAFLSLTSWSSLAYVWDPMWDEGTRVQYRHRGKTCKAKLA